MKLVRFGPSGREKPGILDSKGRIRDLSKVVPDIAGEALSPKGLAKIRKAAIDKLPLVRGNPRLGPCVGGVGNLIAIGLNYSDHAAETGAPVPKEPIIFNKVTSCICGPNDNTVIPKDSSKLDWEVELAIVIGQRDGHTVGRSLGLAIGVSPSAFGVRRCRALAHRVAVRGRDRERADRGRDVGIRKSGRIAPRAVDRRGDADPPLADTARRCERRVDDDLRG